MPLIGNRKQDAEQHRPGDDFLIDPTTPPLDGAHAAEKQQTKFRRMPSLDDDEPRKTLEDSEPLKPGVVDEDMRSDEFEELERQDDGARRPEDERQPCGEQEDATD